MLRLWLLVLPLAGCPMEVDEAAIPAKDEAAPASPATGPTTPVQASSLPGGDTLAAAGPVAPLVSSTDAVPVRIDTAPPRESDPRYTQAQLARLDSVRWSGEIRCEACTGALVLRVVPFQDPSTLQVGAPPSPLTALPIAGPGAFEILLPKGSAPVVLELLVDGDADGKPDRGERAAVVVGDGRLVPDRDRGGFRIDATEPGPARQPPEEAPPGG